MDKKEEFEKLLEKYGDDYQWTINQHYVPQFYLKYFCNDNKKLETLDIKRKKVLKSQSTDHVCSGEYFYSVKTGKKDKISQLIEDCFSEIENEYAKLNDNIISNILNYNQKIDEGLLFNMCEFIALCYLRSLHFRELITSTGSNIIKETLKRYYDQTVYYKPEDPKCIKLKEQLDNGDFDINFDNSDHIKFIFDNFEKITKMLFSKKINIYISNGERNFVTGDCCVKEVTPEIPGPFGVSFRERIHYFALTPKILVEFYDPSKPGKRVKRQTIGKRDVIFFNYFGSRQGNYLYAKSKTDLNIEELIKSRYMFLEKLYNIYPSKYKHILEGRDKIISEAISQGHRRDDALNFYCEYMTKQTIQSRQNDF